jgi:predicted transcriptional regulator
MRTLHQQDYMRERKEKKRIGGEYGKPINSGKKKKGTG